MRSALWGIVVASSTLAGGFALGAGCGAAPAECAELYTCPAGASGGGASSTSTSTSTSSGTGGDGGVPATCVPVAGKDAVADTCGIFVALSGDDTTGVGSKGKPFKTLGAGIAAGAAAMKPVYACAETFPESLIVSKAVGLYGGLDCKNGWEYTGLAKSTLKADADAVPLTVNQTATTVSLFDFKIEAVDAVISGGSSIAVIADHVKAELTRCDLTAGNGVAGVDGMTPTDYVGPMSQFDGMITGNDGKQACLSMGMTQLGGAGKDNMYCPTAGGGPFGGTGGSGEVTVGDNGNAPVATAQTALGGKGQLGADLTLSCVAGAGLGASGTPGAAGGDGAGAVGPPALGQLGVSGYAGVAGMPGDVGKPGQGGGGGGGAKGKSLCAGASGGGGGAGGCGGFGGTGGKAGGASIGLVSLGATLALDTVTIALGAGGKGGDGAFGEGGRTGGNGGTGGAGDFAAPVTSAACDGGKGGGGGTGGHGGGGRGGHAIGIAVSGADKTDTSGVMFVQKGTAGLGGKGGPSQDGDKGVLQPVQMF